MIVIKGGTMEAQQGFVMLDSYMWFGKATAEYCAMRAWYSICECLESGPQNAFHRAFVLHLKSEHEAVCLRSEILAFQVISYMREVCRPYHIAVVAELHGDLGYQITSG
jgi:hypothetical protein